jgi:hypothetical protein
MNYKLSFYATKKGEYFNKYFCWHLKHAKECYSLLFLFYHKDNTIRATFIHDLTSGQTFKYPEMNDLVLSQVWDQIVRLKIS